MQKNIFGDLFNKFSLDYPTPCNAYITKSSKNLLFLALAYSLNSYIIKNINNQNEFKNIMANACPNMNCTLDYYGQKTDQEFICGTCGEYAIIALTGTQAYFIDFAKDLYADFNVLPANISGTNFKIHSGFLNSAMSVYNDILYMFKLYKSQNKKIIITGHSKGGAVAQILSFLLKFRNNLDIDFLITFASPKIFYNTDIVNYMEKYFINKTVHIEAEFDIVTKLFPYYSNACPRQVLKINSYTNLPNSHGINNYIYGLNLKYGCTNNICGCPKNLNTFPFFPAGGTPSKYIPKTNGTC